MHGFWLPLTGLGLILKSATTCETLDIQTKKEHKGVNLFGLEIVELISVNAEGQSQNHHQAGQDLRHQCSAIRVGL